MSDEEELAAKMLNIHTVGEVTWEESTFKNRWLEIVRIARDHFAAKTPGMTEERQSALIYSLAAKNMSLDEAKHWLIQNSIIPRPTPTPGERFAALIDLSEEAKEDGEIARRFDELVGPLIEVTRLASQTMLDRGPDWTTVRHEADAALANFEAKIGGKL